jgi:syntaxin 1B/2/3
MVVNPGMSEQELSSALSDPNTQIFSQALMSSTRSSQAQSTLREVQSRHDDILDIERKIRDLGMLFTELSVMVEFQEVPIDRIDERAAGTQDVMRQGVGQVSRARDLAAAARRKRWWCFGIFVLIIIVVVVVVGMDPILEVMLIVVVVEVVVKKAN